MLTRPATFENTSGSVKTAGGSASSGLRISASSALAVDASVTGPMGFSDTLWSFNGLLRVIALLVSDMGSLMQIAKGWGVYDTRFDLGRCLSPCGSAGRICVMGGVFQQRSDAGARLADILDRRSAISIGFTLKLLLCFFLIRLRR